MKRVGLKIFVLTAIFTLAGGMAHAQQTYTMEPTAAAQTFLQKFKTSPRRAMATTPTKLGRSVDAQLLEEKIDACRRDQSRVSIIRSALRTNRFLKQQNPNRAPYRTMAPATNSASEFLELTDVIDTVQELDQDLRYGEVQGHPWSGDYWAIRTGAIARRYNDSQFPGSTNANTWQEAYDYYMKNPSRLTSTQLMAPSEKYDVLVGDGRFTLTQVNWYEGKRYNDRYGDVEKWMGICHGWAPASFMEPRPSHAITVKSYGDASKEIEFLPDDLKALASLKWANGINVGEDHRTTGSRFLGGRCNEKEPEVDPESGRLTQPACFDLNPGTWHVVVTNQIGREKRPFVIDASFDYEVWNQPVTQYTYTYFNPKTLETVAQLENARVRLDDPEFKDNFKKFRTNTNAVEVVGVVMNLTFVVETRPRGRTIDAERYDAFNTVQYVYDLELDEYGRVIGGEWYQNSHPDFIWMPLKHSSSLNREDLFVKGDEDVVKAAPDASLTMVPLRYVLDSLLQPFREEETFVFARAQNQ